MSGNAVVKGTSSARVGDGVHKLQLSQHEEILHMLGFREDSLVVAGDLNMVLGMAMSRCMYVCVGSRG